MYQWAAFGLHSGLSIASLPTLLVDYPIQRSIGQYETATASLAIDGTQPPNWSDATIPGATLLACWDDDDDQQNILWAGFVTQRTTNADTDTVQIGLVTTEGYFDRRYVHTDLTVGPAFMQTIMRTLIEKYAVDGLGDMPGLPMTVVDVTAATGDNQVTLTYSDANNTTLFEAIQAIAQLTGGPEWVIEWRWNTDMSGINAVCNLASRIGTAAPSDGGSPAATFGMPGCLLTASVIEDYSAEKGGNRVEAYTTTGGVNPSGYYLGTTTVDRPAFELRYEPAGIITLPQLQSSAKRVAKRVVNGTKVWTLVANRATAPMFGRVWSLGDDIGYRLGGLGADGTTDLVPSFPGGVSGTLRAIGVELHPSTITPLIADVDPTQS